MTKQELIEKMAQRMSVAIFWKSAQAEHDLGVAMARIALDVVQENAKVYLPVEGTLPDAMALTRSTFLPGHDRAYIELNTQTDEGEE